MPIPRYLRIEKSDRDRETRSPLLVLPRTNEKINNKSVKRQIKNKKIINPLLGAAKKIIANNKVVNRAITTNAGKKLFLLNMLE